MSPFIAIPQFVHAETSFESILKAAEQGDVEPHLDLGIMYHIRQGVEQNYTEAAKWYRKAAGQGHAMAQYNLGIMYEDGSGVLQSNFAAIDWYSKSGISFLKNGSRKEAFKAYKRIVSLIPNHMLWKKLFAQLYKE